MSKEKASMALPTKSLIKLQQFLLEFRDSLLHLDCA